MKFRANLIFWLIVWSLYLSLVLITGIAAYRQYMALETGWSWDLAYYNQWFWAICFGDETLSVRPIASYATEGPSVWKMNYLSPLRFALLPVYWLRPEPTTLLYLNGLFFWLLIPAAAKLAKDETGSLLAALMILLPIPLTPLLRPLAINDFREMQMALPFAILAVDGWRMRHRGWLITAIIGLLFCRQEWAFVVASLAVIPAKNEESSETTLRWRTAVVMTGLIWFCCGFLIYLKLKIGNLAPQHYMNQFGGPRPSIWETSKTAWDFLWVGLSGWIILAIFAPRTALTALPWVWTLSSGKWAVRFIGTEQWHHARYCVPFVAMGLAAAIVGWGTLWKFLGYRTGKSTRILLSTGMLTVLVVFLAGGQLQMISLMRGIPERVPDQDAIEIWPILNAIPPDDGVVAPYQLTAPISGRKQLFSYVMEVNKPKGWPHDIPKGIQHVLVEKSRFPIDQWSVQGFQKIWSGRMFEYWRR